MIPRLSRTHLRSAIAVFSLLAIAPSAARSAELLAYYNFDGQSADQTGNGADAVLNGGATISADGQGFTSTLGDRALDVGASGNSARADVGGADFSLATVSNAMAVSFWQYNIGNGTGSNSATTPFGVPSSSGGGTRGFQAHTPWSDGRLYFDHGGACCGGNNRRSVDVGTDLIGRWSHVVLQVAAGKKQVWVDGVMLDEQAAGAAPIPAFTGQLMIGAEPAGTNNGFGGRIDEFAVWATFLTAAEIATLAGGAPAFALTDTNTDLPTLSVAPASAISSGAATLHGVVADVGIGAPSVTFFYGDEDGGQDAGAWDSSQALPGTHGGAFSGSVSGLVPATTYFFGARATNAGGERWALETETFTTLPLAPAVANVAASSVEASSATVGATVTTTGGEGPAVTLYYGTVDAGTSAAAWQNSIALGVTGGTETARLGGLSDGTTYFYRAFASNAGGSAWAGASASFTTPVATPASVVNRSAVDITGSTARLRGTVTDSGSDTPVVTFFFGTTDGGTSEAAWERTAGAGSENGDFSKTVSLLVPETPYYFRARVVNSAGVSWAPDSEAFTTTAAAELGVVINEVHYDADPKTEPAEFVELLNAGDVVVDMSGWSLSGVGDYVFPAGTSLAPGEFLVIAEDAATMLSKFGVSTAHEYTGNLSVGGDDLRLLDAGGGLVDRVDYRAGFPWPTAARGTGASMELIHPALDNDLGASWRSSGIGPVATPATYLPAGSTWNYRKGVSEASVPIGAWRELAFVEDGSWLAGIAPIGYGDGDDVTVLGDMQNGYSTVYLRKTFEVPADEIPASLLVRVYADDGAIVWINGFEVARVSVSPGEKNYDDFGTNHEAAWEEVVVNNASNVLVGGSNIVAIHALNADLNSSDFSIDAELKTPDPSTATGMPTPAAANSVVVATPADAPPAIRQVEHAPQQPAGGQEVAVTAKITDADGVGPVTLSYQLVDPGSYIRRSDAAYDSTWTDVPMVDDGSGGDALADDDIFTATMPAALQVHRRLVRYRITAADVLGSSVRVPYADDGSPNFAYFVYGGVPAWTAAQNPGSTAPQTFPAEVMSGQQPVYHLVANSADVANSQYNSGSDGVRMWGTMVYEGSVYDHIQFYNRGEASTYVSGKNKWRFKFNRGRDFEPRDIYGKRYRTTWKTMNFNSCSSPWLASQRGIAGLNEAVPHRLHQLVGVVSSHTHWVHFRVIDAADEAPSDQYAGDFWGLYHAIEHPDGRLLDEHGLPDGNVYKIQGGSGNKKNQGPTQPTSSSDWSSFYGTSANLNTVSWWRDNFHLDSFYSFRAINRATGNVDLRDHTNYYFYHHPGDDLWRVMPWDLDMMYAPVKHVWSGVIRADRCLDHGEIDIEFRNRCREIGDLLFSDIDRHGGHAAQLVEELSQVINPTGVPLTLVDADEFMWGYHPRTNGAHRGPWYPLAVNETRLQTSYLQTIPTSDHEGFQQNLIDYMYDIDPVPFAVNDQDEDGYGWGYLAQEAADNAIPDTPTISYSGDAGFPADGLRFTSSGFADPQGAGTFGSMQWRIGEVSNPMTPDYVAGEPWVYEIEDRWESGAIAPFAAEIAVPTVALRPGRTYRARVRHLDATGRASHWSVPVEFVAGDPDATPFRDGLVISEIMYNPAGGGALEFVEIHNVSAAAIDLTGARFTKGVDFDFPDGTSIASGAYLLVVADIAAFEAEYGVGLPIAGQWQSGDQLSNGGENLKLSLGLGTAIHEFEYDDEAPWPTAPDGNGYSLTLACAESGVDHADAAKWRASVATGGSPGASDGVALAGWLASHGLAAGDQLTDNDSDGNPALIEYAAGTDPSSADAGGGLEVQVLSGQLRLTFRRSRAADGVTVAAETSTDLVTWAPARLLSVTTNADGTDDVTFVPMLSPPSPRQFIRIVVEQK